MQAYSEEIQDVMEWASEEGTTPGDVARRLERLGLPEYLSGDTLPQIGGLLAYLCGLPEMSMIGGPGRLRVVLSRRVVREVDAGSERILPGRVSALSQLERDLTPGLDYRLVISLPWWILASEKEVERGLHELLCYCGRASDAEDAKPTIRKPDIRTHAATLGRYGLSGDREATAIAHALAGPARKQLVDFGFGPDGQGCFWLPTKQEAQ